jgi:hypothetical protein
LHDAVVREALEPVRIFPARDPEEENGLDAERSELACLRLQAIDRELVDAGHRLHRPTEVLAGGDEERVHEVTGIERRLADEVAQRLRPPEAAGSLRARTDLERLERIRLERRHALSPNWSTSA